MAWIDVSDLLADPDFVDSLQIERRTTTVNNYGETTLAVASTITTVGSVQPASAKQVLKLPEALRTADVRAFYIRTEIVQDASSSYPDVIIYGTNRYQIQSAAPWGNYGSGWYEGLCVRQTPS